MDVAAKTVIIDLFPWEYERGFDVGIRRFVANWGRPDAKHYDRRRMEEDRRANAAAALCECAVARYINQFWHGHVWHWSDRQAYRHLADVGQDVEVRRVRTQLGPTVRPGDAGKFIWGARVIGPEWRSVEVLGWVSADTELEGSNGQDVVVPSGKLCPPDSWPRNDR